MSTYLRFYRLQNPPFATDGKQGLVLGTHSLRAAMSEIKQGIEDGSPRICLSGSEGIGKTSLCRALPKLLSEDATVIAILNPERPWEDIRAIVAKKLQLPGGALSRRSLLGVRGATGRSIVIVIDRAELLSHEVLDHLDILLQYKDEEGRQLVHCVMLANLEAAATGAEVPLVWWLDEFTTLQLRFAPIPAQGIRHYVEKHLVKAGWTGGALFDEEACQAIYRNTGGIPRAINEICERALLEAGVRALDAIDSEFIEALCADRLADPSPHRKADPAIPDSISALGGDSFSMSAQELIDRAPDPEADIGPVVEPTFERPLPDSTSRPSPRQGEDSRFRPPRSPQPTQASTRAKPPKPTLIEETGPSLELANQPAPIVPTTVSAAMKTSTGSRPVVAPYRRKRRVPLLGIMLALLLAAVAVMQHTGRIDLLELLSTEVDEVAPTIARVAPKLAEVAPRLAEVAPKLPKLPHRAAVETTDPDEPEKRRYRTHSILDDADSLPPLGDETELEHVSEERDVNAADSESPAHLEAASPRSTAIPEEPAVASAATPAAKPKRTGDVTSDLVVVNEYTSLPDTTAATEVKPTPVIDDPDEDAETEPNTAGSTSSPTSASTAGPGSAAKAAPRTASHRITKPEMPAMPPPASPSATHDGLPKNLPSEGSTPRSTTP